MFGLVSFQEIILKCLSEVYPDFLDLEVRQETWQRIERNQGLKRGKCNQRILSCDTPWCSRLGK